MTLSTMVQWPPSPSVEDEATALAHEHSLDASIEVLTSDDQPALSRGSKDQYPIIVDSDTGEPPKQEEKKHIKHESIAETCASYDSAYSSYDSTGPATPPPFIRSRDRSKNGGALPKRDTETPVIVGDPGQLPPVEIRSSTHPRPQVTRIQTDLGVGLSSTATNARREPSPYFNKGTTPKSRQNSTIQHQDSYMLTPSRAADSPVSIHQQLRQPPTPQQGPHGFESPNAVLVDHRSPIQRHERSKVSDGRDGPRSRIEYPESHRPSQVNARRSFTSINSHGRQPSYEQPERRGVNGLISPPRSRRQSKSSTYGSVGGNWTDHSQCSPSRQIAVESPYTSSAEDSSREHRRRRDFDASTDRRRSRRRPSHRTERRELTELTDASAVEYSSYDRRDPRFQGRSGPITPLTADSTKVIGDYFTLQNAFKENDSKKLQGGHGYRSSGSALVSPMTSRPPTPRLERHSGDHLETSTPNHLSAAMNGTTMIAKTSNGAPRSPIQPTEAFATAFTTNAPNTSQPRSPSLAHNELRPPLRNASYSNLEANHALRDPLAPMSDGRPMPRNSVSGIGNSPHHNTHRSVSYSGSENHAPWGGSAATSGLGLKNVPKLNVPSHNNTTLHDRGTKTPTNSHNIPVLSANALSFPACPRSQPSVGHHDWHTIRGIADLDICPTCIGVVKSTRYQHLFVPSLPRPYEQPSVCALSKPWVRVAFVQSLKQNCPNLDYIRAVVSLPSSVLDCGGNKPNLRRWFDIFDPFTKQAVPDFLICSACACRVDTVFPDLCQVFDRPKSNLAREHVCSLHTTSVHFNSIIEQLDQAHNRCNGKSWRYADVEGLVRHIRRLTRYQPCQRDVAQPSRSWHFMTDLPEFTVCEECYDDVVWPLSDRTIAREISKTLKPVPSQRNSGPNPHLSCQLYSDRMRKIFYDAVMNRDFSKLREAAKTRFIQHQRLADMNKLYEQDQRDGIDRRADIERNQEIWRSIE